MIYFLFKLLLKLVAETPIIETPVLHILQN